MRRKKYACPRGLLARAFENIIPENYNPFDHSEPNLNLRIFYFIFCNFFFLTFVIFSVSIRRTLRSKLFAARRRKHKSLNGYMDALQRTASNISNIHRPYSATKNNTKSTTYTALQSSF